MASTIGPTGEAPPAAAAAPGWTSLLADVPHDPWFRVRVVAMAACAVVYAWWTRVEGLVTDRISASVAIGTFLVAAFLGRPWHRWGRVVVEAACYVALWLAYESTRGIADRLGMPLQLGSVRTIDRVLFLGGQPTEWLQAWWYEAGVVRWHDRLLSLVYYSHFVVPVVAVAGVWAASRTLWLRYMCRLATLIGVACLAFVVVPTVPPWMASDPRFGYGVGEPLVRHTRSGIVDLGFGGFAHDWGVALDWSNVVAAMPSLHAAFSLFVVLYFRPMIRPRWARVAVFAYPALMAVALVYFAEHWAIDVIAGWALTVGVFAAWHRIELRRRTSAVAIAAAALGRGLPEPPPATTLRSRRPRPVLVDRSLVDALVDPEHDLHAAAADRYLAALACQLADEIRLIARADVLDRVAGDAGRAVVAPVARAHVAGQHRRQARRLGGAVFEALEPDTRLTLVVARRERCRELLAIDPEPGPR